MPRKKAKKFNHSIFKYTILIAGFFGFVIIAYVLGSVQGYSKGYDSGVEEGKQQGKIELLEEQRMAAEKAILEAQQRIKREREDAMKNSNSIENPIEDTLKKPFGKSIEDLFSR